MPEFELNKSDWYTPQAVQENDFLNDKLDSDQYGKYYSVQFQGNAETYLMMAKTPPVVGEKYYGHLETTKSGKSTKFKKDKVPEGSPTPAGASGSQPSHSTDENIARSVALKAAVDYVDDKASVEYTLEVAGDFLTWLQGKEITPPKKQEDVVVDVTGNEEIDLNDIPF